MFVSSIDNDVALRLILRDENSDIGDVELPIDTKQTYQDIEGKYKMTMIKKNYFKSEVVFQLKVTISDQDNDV
jgi:hypothetical protein